MTIIFRKETNFELEKYKEEITKLNNNLIDKATKINNLENLLNTKEEKMKEQSYEVTFEKIVYYDESNNFLNEK